MKKYYKLKKNNALNLKTDKNLSEVTDYFFIKFSAL